MCPKLTAKEPYIFLVMVLRPKLKLPPHFTMQTPFSSSLTHQDDPYVPSSDVSKPTDSGVDVSTSPQSSAAWAAASLSPKTGGDPALLLLQKTVPERDDSQSRDLACHSQDCFHNNHVEVSELDLRRRGQEGDKDVTDVESTGNSTSNWGSLDLDVNNICSHPGEGCTSYPLLFLGCN